MSDETSTTMLTITTLPLDTSDSGDGDGDDTGCPPGGCLDLEETTGGPGCASGDGTCNQVDLLFIIDNSGTMGEEQVNLSANFPLLIDKLQMLTDKDGELLNPDVHIMVTTTDVGHPQCTQFQIPGYEPAVGSPQSTACSERLEYFTGLGSNPPSFPEACDCPVPIVPSGAPFIEFSGPMGQTTNVPGDDIKGALSCIGPQGIVGCGYEAPLEAMLQSIYTGAEWNSGNKPFLRDGAILAIAVITDEADCSVRSPDGYAYFTDPNLDTYWEVNPDTGTKSQATSAVCWNAGVDCGAPDGNGVYADCMSTDTGVLHPLSRYLNYLQDELIVKDNKEVIMLGILGVPPVTAHNLNPPFEPTAGGVMDLVYRQWRDGAYPAGDILPDDIADSDAATKEFEFGVGPGCTGEDGMGGFTGQAIPPVRVKEVCEALNEGDKIRCCIESICDTDFSDALGCLTGIIQTVVDPPE
ncbi:hypothetical protein [Enhygromyxa salina]|nr:hypothetical protein [Enhygromyxa salina]